MPPVHQAADCGLTDMPHYAPTGGEAACRPPNTNIGVYALFLIHTLDTANHYSLSECDPSRHEHDKQQVQAKQGVARCHQLRGAQHDVHEKRRPHVRRLRVLGAVCPFLCAINPGV